MWLPKGFLKVKEIYYYIASACCCHLQIAAPAALNYSSTSSVTIKLKLPQSFSSSSTPTTWTSATQKHTEIYSETGSTARHTLPLFLFLTARMHVCVRTCLCSKAATVDNQQEADCIGQEKSYAKTWDKLQQRVEALLLEREKNIQKIIQRETNWDSDQPRKMWLWNNAGGQNVFYISLLPPFLSAAKWGAGTGSDEDKCENTFLGCLLDVFPSRWKLC